MNNPQRQLLVKESEDLEINHRSTVSSDQSLDQSETATMKQQQTPQQVDEEDQAKHHVGPVMGIFFKVWSLVKGKF